MNETDAPPLLSHEEIVKLNAARNILYDLADRALRATYTGAVPSDLYGLGKLSVLAEEAQKSIFGALVVADSYNIITLSQAQLYNEKEDTPA